MMLNILPKRPMKERKQIDRHIKIESTKGEEVLKLFLNELLFYGPA